MRKLLVISTLFLSLVVYNLIDIQAQRRARPGSMKHTEQDAIEATRIKTVSGKYFKSGYRFHVDVYMVGEAGRIKIGTAVISFLADNKYSFAFTNAKFKVEADRKSPYFWESKKLGEDFEQKGDYELLEQFGKTYLVLWESRAKDKYLASIELSNKDTNKFDVVMDEMLIEFSLITR